MQGIGSAIGGVPVDAGDLLLRFETRYVGLFLREPFEGIVQVPQGRLKGGTIHFL